METDLEDDQLASVATATTDHTVTTTSSSSTANQGSLRASDRPVSSINTTRQVGATDVSVPSAEKKDIVHPNDRLLRILGEHSVKKKLPSVAFWDRDYKLSGSFEQNLRKQGVAEERGTVEGRVARVGSGISRGRILGCFS